MSDTIKAQIEDVIRHTLNLPPDEITRALKAGSVTIQGKKIKAGTEVTIKTGLLIQCGLTKLTIVPPHMDQLRRYLDGPPSINEAYSPRGHRKSKLS